MALLSIHIPHEVARALGRVDVPGERVPGEEKHVSLVYLGKNVPIQAVSKAIVVSYEVAARTTPFSLMVDEVSTFPGGDDGFPVIARVHSPELHVLQKALCDGLDRAGVSYSKKFPEYKPHTTFSYSPSDLKPFPFGPYEWTAYELTLWGGESGDDKVSVTLPFATPGKTALYRTLVQAKIRFPANS